MRIPIFQIDAFAARRFSGNPAAVMPMGQSLDESIMQAIAGENNLAETAFIVPEGSDYRIRWFTPTTEVPLCGHATLASAAVVMERLDSARGEVVFHSASGPLIVKRASTGYVMTLPARQTAPVATSVAVRKALRVRLVELLADSVNYLARVESADTVRGVSPDLSLVASLDRRGLIVTAEGDGDFDFISRYFAPTQGISEDSVTGSAHCALTPYWAERLGKTQLRAYQASQRGGEIGCRHVGDQVELSGSCVLYLEGEVEV